MITHDSYTFVESATSGEEWWHIRLNDGDYKDVIYKYGKIQVVSPPDETDDARLQFQFSIIETPEELSTEDLIEDTAFMNHLGDVLTHIIQDSFETGKYKLGENDKPTNFESTVH